MCGVSGYTGLGYLSADLRFDLVEALGSGIDKRGGHAAGCVVVPDEGSPRLMRKLGSWDAARGRFIRAASQGHSVMMHARFATHGKRDDIENAHPFAVKRKDSEGKDFTVLYGCHNGVLWNAEESAKKHGRTFTVDSLEFFELLADKAFETIKALSGYGVVTWIRPEDRKVRILRLSNNSDIVVYRLKGGGLVWGSTASIVKDALQYVALEVETELSVKDIGKVYCLSGQEAKETKLDGLQVTAGMVDRRTYGSYGWSNDWDDYTPGGMVYGYGGKTTTVYNSRTGKWESVQPAWDECCWVCGEFNTHKPNCKDEGGYQGKVIAQETIRKNRAKFEKAIKEVDASLEVKADSKPPSTKKPDAPKRPVPDYASPSGEGKLFRECEDGTFRCVGSNGKVIPYARPIYVRENGTGAVVKADTIFDAERISGKKLSFSAEVKSYAGVGHRVLLPGERKSADTAAKRLSETVAAPVGHNGQWSVPQGLSPEEEAEWLKLHKASPRLAEAMMADDENELAEAIDAELCAVSKEGE